MKTKTLLVTCFLFDKFFHAGSIGSRDRVRILIKLRVAFFSFNKGFLRKKVPVLSWPAYIDHRYWNQNYLIIQRQTKEKITCRLGSRSKQAWSLTVRLQYHLLCTILLLGKPPCSCYLGDCFHDISENVLSTDEKRKQAATWLSAAMFDS